MNKEQTVQASTSYRVKLAENNRKDVIDAIVDGGCKNIAEVMTITGLGRDTIRKHIRYINENQPEVLVNFELPKVRVNRIITSGGKIVKPVERYPETKNDEGYSDPTAAKAMKNTAVEYNPDQFGRIFEMTSPTTNENDYYIMIQDYGSRGVLAIPMVKERNWRSSNNSGYVMNYRFEKELYYIDIRAMYLRPTKYIINHDCGVVTQNTLMSIRTKMYRMLGFNIPEVVEKVVEKEVPVEVEKIIEKEVPVEVEKIVEKEVKVEVPVPTNDIEQIDRALEQQRAKMELEKEKLRGDIWEEVGRSLIKALSGNEAEVM